MQVTLADDLKKTVRQTVFLNSRQTKYGTAGFVRKDSNAQYPDSKVWQQTLLYKFFAKKKISR